MSIRLGLALLVAGCGGHVPTPAPHNHHESGIPKAFVEAVDRRIAADQMHVTDWWADDLDGDKVDEAIALVCNAEKGFFLVMHGTELLEAPIEIDGRNSCPDAARPDWTRRTGGQLTQDIAVHHGSMQYGYAIRDGKMVLVSSVSSGFDVNRDGSHDSEKLAIDYDKLTYTQVRDPGGTTTGVVVLAGTGEHRATTLVGKTTLRATKADGKVTLHVHADRELEIGAMKLAAGDHDVAVEPASELQVHAGGTTHHVYFDQFANGSYPTPPQPW